MPVQDSRGLFSVEHPGVDPRAPELERARDERNSGDFASLHSRSLPPPMAMSLRTRESSSLALKHIFDQMNSSAEAAQTLDPPLQGSRGAPVLEKREDDGKREGPGSAKDCGVGTSIETVLDNLQRTGAGVVPNPAAQAFKRYSNGRDDEDKGLEVSRRALPQTEGAHAKSPAASPSEKDFSFGSWNSERSVSLALQHAQLEHLRKRLPDFDVSFRKTQTQSPPFSHQSAFGNPISTSSRPSPADLSTPPSPALRPLPEASLPRAAFRPGMSNSLSRQPTAQLTIFYSGTVNVYDDVPADKAHAIMLLAGNGNSWSSNFESAPLPDRERAPQLASPSAVATPPAAPLSAVAAPGSFASVGTAIVNTRAVTFGSPAPSMPPTLAIPPAVASPAITVDAKTQTAAKRPHAGIELPHARKASLARFLEKRKDRVQVKPQENVANESQEKAEASSEKPCTPTKKQRNARSRSSSPS